MHCCEWKSKPIIINVVLLSIKHLQTVIYCPFRINYHHRMTCQNISINTTVSFGWILFFDILTFDYMEGNELYFWLLSNSTFYWSFHCLQSTVFSKQTLDKEFSKYIYLVEFWPKLWIDWVTLIKTLKRGLVPIATWNFVNFF